MQSVEWGEYKISDLFDSANGDFDIQRVHINGKGSYVITSGLTDNGILGRSDISAKLFESKTITIDMFGNVFFRQFEYKMVTHARVFSIKPKFHISNRQGLFLTSCFNFLKTKYGYENMCSWEKIKKEKIVLPQKNNEINFDFMESFIAELETRQVAELKAYLKVSGLDNYELSIEELNALQEFRSLVSNKWGKYKIGDLFERIKTNILPYKAKELPKQATGKYTLPCLTSSFQNQGLNYYVPKDEATVLKNVISIPSNSDVYRAYYQSREFTVLSDAYAIRWKLTDTKITPNHCLFMVMCINKVTDLPIYSYKNKLGGWKVVKEKYIQLPVADGKINFELMEKLISAIKKVIIKDVVLYTDNRIKVI